MVPPVNCTLLYVPAVYPDPALVTVPIKDCMSASKVAPVPPPPTKVRVGADVYPIPPSAIVTDDILPSISLMTGAVSYTHLTLPTNREV